MAWRIVIFLAGLFLGASFLRADDPFPSQTSPDARIKVTLLYVGPVNDPQIHQPFVIMYMLEDCRTDEELKRHPWKLDKNIDQEYYLAPSTPELRDAKSVHAVFDADERARMYTATQTPFFKSSYPNLTLPPTDHPDNTRIYEYFLKTVPTAPVDITFHDSIPAYHSNTFKFQDVSFSPPAK